MSFSTEGHFLVFVGSMILTFLSLHAVLKSTFSKPGFFMCADVISGGGVNIVFILYWILLPRHELGCELGIITFNIDISYVVDLIASLFQIKKLDFR